VKNLAIKPLEIMIALSVSVIVYFKSCQNSYTLPYKILLHSSTNPT